MFISNVTWERPCDQELKTFGRIWYSFKNDKARLYLMGWRYGRWLSQPYDNLPGDAPYLDGDIVALLNSHGDDSRAVWCYCGHMGTTESSDGKRITYWGDLDVMPFKSADSWNKGFFLIIQQAGKEDDYVTKSGYRQQRGG